MAASPFRAQVLALYRRILTCAKTWQAKEASATAEERAYIHEEARHLFRANKGLSDEEAIRRCIREAEARLTMGGHYRNPYPRPVHFPPQALTRTQKKQWGSANLLRQSRSRPIYVNTLDQDHEPSGKL